MTKDVTLAQLATEMARLRQQVEAMSQRLDMIYGAVTRLADQSAPAQSAPPQTMPGQARSNPQASPAMSAAAMMSPGSMLDALRQHANQLGMDVSVETVERLKRGSQPESSDSEESSQEE